MDHLPEDLIQELNNVLEVELKTDATTRILYSTDASLYKMNPLGVAFPKRIDELNFIMELAGKYRVPVLARGSGSSLAGQAIAKALIVDCSRYLDNIIDINPEEQTITVEPGVILNTLNHYSSKHRLQFGPDPSSSERATIGGSVSNNATGSHSIIYGMSADHVLSIDTVLSDGSQVNFHELPLSVAENLSSNKSTLGNIYQAALRIRERLPDIIADKWPKTYRTVSGYNLNYLLPWSLSKPPRWSDFFSEIPYPPVQQGNINIAQLIAGSEGTLGIIRTLVLRLVPLPRYKILVVLGYKNIYEACDEVPYLLESGPSAIELIPQELVRLARTIPGYTQNLPIEFDSHEAFLVLEFASDEYSEIKSKAKMFKDSVLIAESSVDQDLIWSVRKVGLGILMSRPGDYKPIPGVEDMSVPVDNLGSFVREVQEIIKSHNTSGEFYGHASAGCLHVRPILNIKTSEGRDNLRGIGRACVDLVEKYGGSISAEHGDGLARGEWLEKLFGHNIVNLFKDLKNAADPYDLLNPGKIINVPSMDHNLRFPSKYHAKAWIPSMDFSHQGGFPGERGIIGAAEQCNGAGVCRKHDGFMCPSFQVTRDEMHSTRGRANLLRELFYEGFPNEEVAVDSVFQALDLCLACKGCRVECPSAVDIAKLKYEFLDHYYKAYNKRRRIRDYLFGYIEFYGRLFYPFAEFVNILIDIGPVKSLGDLFFGISRHRNLPRLSNKPFPDKSDNIAQDGKNEKVILMVDVFNRYFYPEVSRAAYKLLTILDYDVLILPVNGAGRTLISKGFLSAALSHANKLVESINQIDPTAIYPIIGLEPSEIYTLKDEMQDLIYNDSRVKDIGKRVFMIDEFLIRPGKKTMSHMKELGNYFNFSANKNKQVFLHGHCYQKSQGASDDGHPVGVQASKIMLEQAGYHVHVIDDGCCGMAGSFGYEAEHFEVSMEVGELALFPTIRNAIHQYGNGLIIATPGVSCRSQIEDGTTERAVHPILLINR